MWRKVNPFEAAVVAAATVIGAAGVYGQGEPNATLTAVWGSNATVYFLLLFLGGLCSLFGILFTLGRGDTAAGRGLWTGGLISIMSAWGIYGLALWALGTSVTSTVLLLILALASLVRVIQLRPKKKNERG